MRKIHVIEVMKSTDVLPFRLPLSGRGSEGFSCFNIRVKGKVSKSAAGENHFNVPEQLSKDRMKKTLERKISNLRKEMITAASKKGLNNPETIELSQKLDVLLNQYQKLK